MREMAKRIGVLSMAILLGGCAAIRREEAQHTESTLSAAGFQMKPADTPERVAHLQSMTPLKVVPHMKDGKLLYVYADPKSCKCLFVGDEQAYQRYQALAIKEQLTQEQMMAAQMNEDAAMNWGLWGPFWW
jgi:Tfp pilus assembly PilM family ATPase